MGPGLHPAQSPPPTDEHDVATLGFFGRYATDFVKEFGLMGKIVYEEIDYPDEESRALMLKKLDMILSQRRRIAKSRAEES